METDKWVGQRLSQIARVVEWVGQAVVTKVVLLVVAAVIAEQ